jgi:hypothetical protein
MANAGNLDSEAARATTKKARAANIDTGLMKGGEVKKKMRGGGGAGPSGRAIGPPRAARAVADFSICPKPALPVCFACCLRAGGLNGRSREARGPIDEAVGLV